MSASDPVMSKTQLRAEARARRRAAFEAAGPGIGDLLAQQALAALPFAPTDIVAGYRPVREEIDSTPLLRALADMNILCALPAVTADAQALQFRVWRQGDVLISGRFDIHEPPADAPAVTPTIVLAPLLAFDSAGHRLGYGGGFYDRTLAALRAQGRVLAVGLAFAAQQTDPLPAGPHDQKLDWIVTEQGARQFA